MKTIKFGQMKGYPMYQKINQLNATDVVINLISEKENLPVVGNKLEKGNNFWIVKEIKEERTALGNHPKEVIFQSLVCGS